MDRTSRPAEPRGAEAEYRYDAFLSYRRSDGGVAARWLRRQLQGFKLPRALREGRSRRLRIYLDEAYEVGTNDFYENTIRPALLQSRHLIVVATPDSLVSREGDWIVREIEDFRSGQRGESVLAVRAAGALDDPLPGRLAELYRQIEIVDLRDVSRLTPFLPWQWFRLRGEVVKLVAPLFELEPEHVPVLRLEEARRRQANLGTVTGALSMLVVAIAALAAMSVRQASLAQRRLEDAIAVTDGIVVSIDRELEALGTPRETREQILDRSCALLERLRFGSDDDEKILESVLTCYEHRAKAFRAWGEWDRALAEQRRVYDVWRRRAEARPGEGATSERAARAGIDLAEIMVEAEKLEEAGGTLTEAREILERAEASKGEDEGRLVARAELEEQLASVESTRERWAPAARSADAAVVAHRRLAELRPEDGDRLWIATRIELLAAVLTRLDGRDAEAEERVAALLARIPLLPAASDGPGDLRGALSEAAAFFEQSGDQVVASALAAAARDLGTRAPEGQAGGS